MPKPSSPVVLVLRVSFEDNASGDPTVFVEEPAAPPTLDVPAWAGDTDELDESEANDPHACIDTAVQRISRIARHHLETAFGIPADDMADEPAEASCTSSS